MTGPRMTPTEANVTPTYGVYTPHRIIRVCLACATQSRFRWAVVSGACEQHRTTVPADAAPITLEPIIGIPS